MRGPEPRHRGKRRVACGSSSWLTIVLAMLFFSDRLEADDAPVWSGRVAVSRPLTGILLDGDLSDWPQDLPRYSIQSVEVGLPPESAADLTASFRVAHDPEKSLLLVAVEVVDDDHFFDPSSTATWDSQDGCMLFLDPSPGSGRTSIQFNYYGTSRPSGVVANAESRQSGNRRDYEWAIDLSQIPATQRARLQSGEVFGLEVVVGDYDRPLEQRGRLGLGRGGDFTWIAWSRGAYKPRDSWRRGQVILGDRQALGDVTVRVRGAGRAPVLGAALQIIPTWLSGQHALSARTDEDGSWSLSLPPGQYRLDSSRPGFRSETIEVKPGQRLPISKALSVERPVERSLGPVQSTTTALQRFSGDWFHLVPFGGFGAEDFAAIVEDASGNVWLGTSSGLLCYDGRTWSRYDESSGLVGGAVRCLTVARDGALWVGTEEAVHRIRDGRLLSMSPREGLIGGPVFSIHEQPQGCFWLGTLNGLQRWRDGQLERVDVGAPIGSVFDFSTSHDGSMWIATESGLFRHRNEEFSWVDTPLSKVQQVHESTDGRLYVGSRYRGCHVLHPGSDSWQVLTIEGGVLSIVEDAAGTVWVATAEQILRQWEDREEELFPRFQVGRGDGLILTLYCDRESTIWVGTATGVSGYRHALIRPLPILEDVSSLDILGSDAWVGCESALYRVTDGALLPAAESLWDRFGRVEDTHVDRQGRVWVATYRCLARLTEDGWEDLANSGSGVVPALSIAEDHQGRVWVGTSFGIQIFDGDDRTSMTTADGLHSDRIPFLLADSQGRLWLGSDSGLQTWSDGRLETEVPGAGQPGFVGVRCLFEDSRKRIWVGARDGLWVLDSERWSREGPGGVVSVAEDSEGRLCFASAQQEGVTLIFEDLRYTLTLDDGLPSAFVTRLAFGPDDQLWMLGDARVVRYRRQRTPPILLSCEPVSGELESGAREFTFTSDQSLVAFELRAVSHRTRPEALRYRYRVPGHVEEWRWSPDGRVELGSLPAGRYFLEAEAIDADLNRSSLLRRPFRVVPPWRRLLVGSALVLALVILLWQAIQIVQRNRQVRQAKTDLEQRVAQRTEELAVAYENLLESEARFRELVEFSPFGIHQMDLTARVLSSNPAGESLWAPDGKRREAPEFLMAVAERDRHRIGGALKRARAGEIARFEFSSPDGRSFEGSFVPIPAEAPAWLLGLSLDVSEHKQVEQDKQRLEDQLHQSIKLETIGRLTGGIVHDFNNILTALLAETEPLAEDRPSSLVDTDQRDRLDEIRETVLRGSGLTRQLLEFTRHQGYSPQRFDLAELLRSFDGLLRRITRQDITVRTQITPETAWVEADAHQLEQVLLNLAINAGDAMLPDGGFLDIDLRTLERSSHPTEPGSRCHLLSVRDSGPGIPDDVLPKIFEPFFTTKPVGEGTGLGLSSVQSIIRRFDGTLEARNHPDGGAVFEISLPAAAPVDLESPESRAPHSINRPGRGEWILVCDDDEAVRRSLSRSLIGAGYRVEPCADGRSALALVAGGEPPIGLALIDIVMPDLNGIQVARSLMAIRPDLRILFSSGYASEALRAHDLSERCEFIEKPFSPSELFARVRELLDRKREPAT